MGKLLVGIGVWLLSDGIVSWFLYLRAPGYNGQKQTFWRDHWIRLVRIICAAGIIAVGSLL
jgi:hypothetical protein